jgi:Arc/MetJ-type ribon-helix-helix transcriptional regulator
MTIHLPPEIERSIQAAVHNGHFASVDDAMTEAASLLLEQLRQKQTQAKPVDAAPRHKPIWEEFEEIAASIPQEVWAQIPADSSEQLDHYIYGTPKRTPSA